MGVYHASMATPSRRARRLSFRIVAAVVAVVMAVAACGNGDDDASSEDTSTSSSTQEFSGPVGPIVFHRMNPASDEESFLYTASVDGSDVELLFAGVGITSRWSPDGSEISIFCCDDGMAAHFLDVESGEIRSFPQPDPALELFCGGSWSPDGERVTCASFGDPSRNGIYSVRASDGGDLTRITSNPDGEDLPGDYSPDGTRLVLIRSQEDRAVGYFVANVDGSGLRQLTPPDMLLDDSGFAGRWSPDGSDILFVARSAETHHKAIWIVDADSGTPEQLPIEPACGGPMADPDSFGCYSPDWSPDGSKIVFTRSDGDTESIYMVNADGTGIVQITDGEDDNPDWGT